MTTNKNNHQSKKREREESLTESEQRKFNFQVGKDIKRNSIEKPSMTVLPEDDNESPKKK